MEEQDVIKALAALAQESRLRVFRTLVVAGPLGLTPGAKEALLDDAGRIAPAWIAHAFDLWTRGADASALATIVCPTLVIATDDPFLPHALLQEQVVDPIAGARLERLHGPGHYPQNERPEETSALLQAFWKMAGEAS